MSDALHFDENYEETATLADGTEVLLRLVSPSDKALLAQGFRRLSPQSRYFRFMGPKNELSDDELRYFTELDGVDHFALGAVRVDAIGREEGLGVARFVRFRDEPEVAEPAVAVIDDVQGLGLGTLLVRRLTAAAWERGVRRLRCDFMADNRRMLELFRDALRELADDVSVEHEGDVMRAEIVIPQPPGSEPLPEIRAEGAVRRLLRDLGSGEVRARIRQALLDFWELGRPAETDEVDERGRSDESDAGEPDDAT